MRLNFVLGQKEAAKLKQMPLLSNILKHILLCSYGTFKQLLETEVNQGIIFQQQKAQLLIMWPLNWALVLQIRAWLEGLTILRKTKTQR